MKDARDDLRTWARVEALARSDKWYLSAGDGVLWAPPFPRWLYRPGFWDGARVYHFPMAPCYAVSLLTGDGAEDPLEREGTHWRPDRLRVRWKSRSGLYFTETRYLLPGGRLCSAWRTEEELGWPNPTFEHRFLTAHTVVPAAAAEAVRRLEAGVAWRRLLENEEGDTLTVDQSLDVHLFPPRGRHPVAPEVVASLHELTRRARARAARCEGHGSPEWARTPFAESFEVGDGPPWPEDLPDPGGDVVHLATVLPLAHLPARHAVGFVLRVVPRVGEAAEEGGAAAAQSGTVDGAGLRDDVPAPLPRPARSRAGWTRAFARYPRLRCSDELLAGYVDYRVYGLHLNRLAGGRRHLPFPAVAEGVGPLHHPTAGSAPCHMLETRWSTDPSVARGTLLNFVAHQREDGSFPTRLYLHRPPDDDICHMNWGDAVRAVDRLHPQRSFLERAYGALSHYGEWIARTRDPEGSGLITLHRAQEASQDHTPRWEAASGPALKAVDASVCACQLWQALAEMAGALGYEDEVGRWESLRSTSAAALETLWDEEAGIYRDLDPATGSFTDVRSSAGFRPLLTELPSPDRVRRLLEHLEPGGAFATPFPLPTLASDDPRFDAEGFWHGRRRKRPFNGRAWPTATCHVLEGLLRQWHRGVTEAGSVAARLLPAFVRMMHAGEAPPRPNAYEHYNPLTGRPSLYRGLDDHQRSWVLDLTLRGVAGVEPLPGGLRVHPLPLGLEAVELTASLREREVRVEVRGEDVELSVDGAVHRTTVGSPLEISW